LPALRPDGKVQLRRLAEIGVEVGEHVAAIDRPDIDRDPVIGAFGVDPDL